jgi:hypothetical protein
MNHIKNLIWMVIILMDQFNKSFTSCFIRYENSTTTPSESDLMQKKL